MGLNMKKSMVISQTDNQSLVKQKKIMKPKKRIKWVVILIVLILIVLTVYNRVIGNRFRSTSGEIVVTTAKVETRDILNTLTSSGAIEPLNTYEVKTLIEGEVISADFEEGDNISEGQILYQITTENLDNKIDTSQTSVDRAEKDYDKATKNYNKAKVSYEEALASYEEAQHEYSDLTLTADSAGVITEIFVTEGEQIQEGSQIASIYDNSYMFLEIYFNAAEISSNIIGKSAKVELSETSEEISGTVTKVSEIEEVLSGNRIVKKVTIKVKNPGGLTTSSIATATIDDIYSSETGSFKVFEDTVLKAYKSGEIGKLNITEGRRISTGDIILSLEHKSQEDKLESYQKEVDNAKDSLDNAADSVESALEGIEDAKTSLEEVIDSKTDYSVKAPISGKIIRKTALSGDTINSSTALCVIYDLSAVTFEMSVDELDVMSVAVGQTVNITADALEGVEIVGVVTNISLESTNSGGVTQYPVTVRINEVGNLLPGMNVTGEIIVEEAKNVLAVPTDALMRGDLVYVADDTVTESVGIVPVGFKEVQVETGLTDGDYIEIISGLTGEEEVYTPRSASGTAQDFFPMQGGFGLGTGGQGMPSGGNFDGGSRPSGATGPGGFGGGNTGGNRQ